MFCFDDMFERELRQIDQQGGEMLDLVRKLAEINSGSDNLAGLARVEAELIELLKRLTPDVRSIELPPGTRMDSRGNIVPRPLGRAIIASKHAAAPIRVLLNIHYDTVFGADHPFQRVGQIDANTLRGPGVADAKGGIV